MRNLLLVGSSLFTSLNGLAEDSRQEEPSTSTSQPNTTKSSDKKIKQKLSSKEMGIVEPITSDWFPDWGQPKFDWFIRPVIGLQYAEHSSENGSHRKSTALEIGAQAGLLGVPLVNGNPGLILEPKAGYSYGNVSQITNDSSENSGKKVEQGAYHRTTVGISAPYNVAFYRLTPQVTWGRIQGKLTPQRVSFETSLDQGILMRSFLSTHLTTTWLRLSGSNWSEVNLKSFDIWWSLRAFTSVAKAQIAVGPGITWSDYKSFADSQKNLDHSVRSTDFRLISSANLFWKLGASVSSKYTVSSSSDEGSSLTNGPLPDLPTQNLGEQSRIITREKDSLASTAFVGISNVFYGVGFGYFHTLWIESLTGGGPKGTTQGKTTQSSGVGAHYEAAL
jgi:hypothetical protein